LSSWYSPVVISHVSELRDSTLEKLLGSLGDRMSATVVQDTGADDELKVFKKVRDLPISLPMELSPDRGDAHRFLDVFVIVWSLVFALIDIFHERLRIQTSRR
jgi:hypothetical protein